MAMWGSDKAQQRRDEREAHQAKEDQRQWDQGTELENLLRGAETDLESARLIELARLLDGASFHMREEGLERVRQMRMGRQGNDPDFQSVIRVHERIARLHIEFAVKKAEAVLGLVRSWG